MNTVQAGTLAARVLSIWLAVLTLNTLSGLPATIALLQSSSVQGPETVDWRYLAPTVFLIIAYGAGAIWLWLLSDKFMPRYDSAATGRSLDSLSLYRVGMSVLGLYFVFQGIPLLTRFFISHDEYDFVKFSFSPTAGLPMPDAVGGAIQSFGGFLLFLFNSPVALPSGVEEEG